MKKFDPTKPVQTRGGCSVRILATNLKTKMEGRSTIVAAVEYAEGLEVLRTYDSDGVFTSGFRSCFDLVNVPPAKHLITCWAVVYPSVPLTGRPNQVDIYHTVTEAQRNLKTDAIAMLPIQIEFVEGQGL